MRTDIIITKASGKKEPFEKIKLYQSLLRAGASETLANQIVQTIEMDLTEEMSTKSIYKMAHNLLSEAERPVAGRYHLKNGIMELGPSGFPFEKYVSVILAHQGYTVQVGKMVDGKCVKHEVDVIAEKGEEHFMIECKYHNSPGINCDVKIPLYINSRFKDIESKWMVMSGHGTKFHQGWVVTNTRFTTDAITYGSCAGLKLISLDFPKIGSLREMIEETGLYPLTCLTSLTDQEKKILLGKKVVLCMEVCEHPQLLDELNIPSKRIEAILKEGNQLCHKLIRHGQH
jgi:hypothetical protein